MLSLVCGGPYTPAGLPRSNSSPSLPSLSRFYTCNGNTGLFFESTLGCRSAFVNATLTRYTQILNGAVTSTRGLTVLSGAGAINAYSVQVRFQSTDFQPTGPGATAPPTSRPLASTLLPAPTTSAAPPPGGVGGGISAAAAAGIAVAVTLLVLAVVGAGCFMLYLRRKKRRQQQQQQAGGQAAAYVESGGVTPGGGAGGVSYYGPPSSTSPELSKQLQTAGAGYGFQQQQQPRHRPLEVEQHELAGWSPGGPPVELDHGQGVARPS